MTGPEVPGGKDGQGHTSVHTPSMDLFAKNIGILIAAGGPLRTAQLQLSGVNAQPGAFYHADQIRTKIGGANGDAGLKAQFTLILNDLLNGLTTVQTAMQDLSTKYKSTEEANGISVKDLQTDFDTATTYFASSLGHEGSKG